MKRQPDPVVLSWLARYDAELALPTVTIAEIAYGIQKIHPDQRATSLSKSLSEWRNRFAGRVFGLTEEAAMAYGDLMGDASRKGRGMSAQDGMIAAIARVNGNRLATRNTAHFETAALDLISPWEF
jgi:predicted nucleic acid-binding protein